MAVQEKVDVVTVGAGLTAAVMAWRLTEAGLRVVSLEQGPIRWTNPDYLHNHDSLRYTIRKALMVNLRQESWTWRPNPQMPSLPMRQYGTFHPGQGLGGASIHWAGQIWRFNPTDFLYRSHHIDRYGEDRLPEGNRIQDWPITYDDLERHYDQSEYDFGVSGVGGNLGGTLVEGGNPFEGPRQRPYPLPPNARSIPALMFDDVCRDLGYHPFPQPAGIISEGYTGLSGRPRSGCLYCGYCTRYGCHVDAKSSAATDYIPVALETGLYEIRPNCYVTEILTNDDGLATGLAYIDIMTGERHEQPADIVILSGFTLTNVRLMLLSRGMRHPDGVGNDRGWVGQNYTYQLDTSPVSGVFEGRRFNLYMGHSCINSVIHDLNSDNFDHSDLDFIGGASITCGTGEREPITGALGIPPLNEERWEDAGPNGNDNGNGNNGNGNGARPPAIAGEVGSLQATAWEWGEDWKENLRDNWDAYVGIAIQGESLPYDDQLLDLDPNYRDAFGLPLLRVTFDWHENDYRLYEYIAERCGELMEAMGPTRMSLSDELDPYNVYDYQSTHPTGGAIMGTSPDNSVTNKFGQVWDTPNVFVTGAALFPQNSGMNPTGTVLALAYLGSEGIVEHYLDDPERIIDDA